MRSFFLAYVVQFGSNELITILNGFGRFLHQHLGHLVPLAPINQCPCIFLFWTPSSSKSSPEDRNSLAPQEDSDCEKTLRMMEWKKLGRLALAQSATPSQAWHSSKEAPELGPAYQVASGATRSAKLGAPGCRESARIPLFR